MAIKFSYNGATILAPGPYFKLSVNQVGGMPLGDTGIVGIVGEADKGAPGDASGESVQEFTSAQLTSLIDKYVSGNIVDAARLLINPSRDNRVINGAQKVLVWKTNSSTISELSVHNLDDVPAAILNFDSKNYGLTENLINMYIASGVSHVDAEGYVVSDSAISFPIAVASADTLKVTVNGVTYTLTVSTAPGGSVSMTQSQWVTLLNGVAVTVGSDTATPVWAALKPVIAVASGTTKIKLTLDTSIVPFTKYENSLEYAMMSIETSSIKTTLNLTVASSINTSTLVVAAGGAGPVRGSRGGRIFIINRGSSSETVLENDNEECFKIRYKGAGTACAMTISGVSDDVKILSTSCAGAAGDNLSIALNAFSTIQDLVNYITNVLGGTKYKCVTSYSKRDSRAPVLLDRYDAIEIKALPLGVKCAMYEMEERLASSNLVSVTRNAVYGQIETISSSAKEFFTGAVKGASLNQDFQDGFDALLAKRIVLGIPLISQDAADDITDGLTDAGSTYDIASVNAQADAHCRLASNTKNRSERQGYISIKDTFVNSREAAKTLSSEFCSMAFQDQDILDVSGALVTKQPWAGACLAAGMQAGSEIGEPTTWKYVNSYGISHQDFAPFTDMDSAIEDGLLVFEHPDSGGYRIACQNTTYGKDDSFVWNRASVISAAFYVAYDSRKQLGNIYIGTGRERGSTTLKSVTATIISIMDRYREAGILVGDETNDMLGYKNLTVSISGGTISFDITITPVSGVDFILENLCLDMIRDSTSA